MWSSHYISLKHTKYTHVINVKCVALRILVEGIFAEGTFAEGILAERNFSRTEFLPNRIFAERKFRRPNYRQTEVSPKNYPKLRLQARREVDENQQSINIGLVRNTNRI